MDRVQCKLLAKQQIKGNVWMYLLATLIYGVISAIIPGVATIILAPVMTMGLYYLQLGIRNGEGVRLEKLFAGFNDFGRSWCTVFLMELFTFLWTLLFIIPGIVKKFAYAMAPYIVAENPDISATDAIAMSQKMMKGHKWELFVLYLSFIGWFLLSCVTFGLSNIYTVPYLNLSVVNFYDSIKAQPIAE